MGAEDRSGERNGVLRQPAAMYSLQELVALRFPLDDNTLRQAEEASSKFVNGPWNLATVVPQLISSSSDVQGGIGDGRAAHSSVSTACDEHGARPDGRSKDAEVADATAATVPTPEAEVPAASASPGMSPAGESPGAAAAEVAALPGRPAAAAASPTPSSPSSSPKPATTGPKADERRQEAKPVPVTPSFAARKTWASVVSKDEHEAAMASASKPPKERDEGKDSKGPKNSIVDFLLWKAKLRADEGPVGDPPEDLKKYENALESGINNASKAKYVRRGMRNDAGGNNCYVNVVVQSLLPCSALMQLLSHCAQNDTDRPFYTGMVRLCREFHGRKDPNEPCNVLFIPQVMEIISRWRSIGAQQDAGEFLFYMLNGMHEECKWKSVAPGETTPEAEGDEDGHGEAVSGEAEVRSAGVHEDSPVVRIFGGLIRSSVRSKNAKADSVSLEPFNHLILDISSQGVDSVWTALEAYCGAEAVNEGLATKRLQFQSLPKVLILNLKRFSYNKDTGRVQKIMKAVKYDETLVFDKDWLVDDLASPEYQLTSVICHHGDSVNGGHYNAAVRYNAEWYMFDDAIVREMQPREVMNQHYTAYLLVYLCHDKVDIRP